MTATRELGERLDAAFDAAVVGLGPLRTGLCVALVARGHALVEGPPGLGKTLLARTFARAIGGTFQRVQGTADLMPADLTGQTWFDATRQAFQFRRGPVFADVLLVDELNRAGPKTQSALLEAMAERHVTIDRERHALPAGFLVIATQNPQDFEGTYPLPESQLDRFMLCLQVGYPSADEERAILARYGEAAPVDAAAGPVAEPLPAALLEAAREECARLHVAPELSAYVLELVRATREHPALQIGASTRAALALLHAARAACGLRGGEYVAPDDVQAVVRAALVHRIACRPEAALDGRTPRDVLDEIVGRVAVPR
jgi:MoxR-like ATPase